MNEYTYEPPKYDKLKVTVAIDILGIIIGLPISFSYEYMGFGVLLLALAILTLFSILPYLIAKEFEFIALEKGYNGKKYFWYSFLLGIVGYMLVIALPKK